ncbi:MAG: hypothetical protein KF862_14900 [Chitinophagaceae bacterium]|nr:hypothetical protein [Chitinophagaceae bacterium]
MKQYIITSILFMALLFMQSCKKEEIYVYNTQNTPDLSNPIIQKMTNVVWYKEVAFSNTSTVQIWASQNNIYKPADYLSSILYHAAWTGLILNRDGTSIMTFVPPFAANAVIHAKGNWTVSTEEENTIILSTKTPVSSVTGKLKVLNMETQDNTSIVKLSVDFGDRLITTELSNKNPFEYLQNALFRALDYSWFANKTVSTAPIKASEFIGAWAAHGDGSELTDYDMIRYTHIEDLLANTPTLLIGLSFDLEEGGKAKIVYTGAGAKNYLGEITENESIVYSDARWSVNGDKIRIETDEELFFSIGEQLFRLPSHYSNLTLLGYLHGIPVRIKSHQLYNLEIVEKTNAGFWTRVTTKTETFYVFLQKSPYDKSNMTNIKNIFDK